MDIKQVKAFMTTDGKLFHTESVAMYHQSDIDYIKEQKRKRDIIDATVSTEKPFITGGKPIIYGYAKIID